MIKVSCIFPGFFSILLRGF